MLEKDIVNSILRYLKTIPGCFAWKTHGDAYSTSGIPDIIACIGGRFVALEVKTPSGRLSKLQEITLRRINAAGGIAREVRSLDEVRAVVDELHGKQ